MAYGTYIEDILQHYPIGTPEVAKQYRASFHALLSANIGRRGLEPQNLTDYGLLRQIVSEPIMVTGRKRQVAVVEGADGATAQGSVYLKQLTGAINWDIESLENASGDRQVFDLITKRWDRFIGGFIGVLNAVDYGDGTGRLARVVSNTDNSTYYTVVVDNSMQDFGWTLLSLVENGMLVDIMTVPDITGSAAWTEKVKRGEVYGVNKTAGTFNVRALTGVTDSALSAEPADGDFVFLSGAFTLDSDDKFSSWDLPMGLHGILDDGGAAGNEFDDGASYYNGSYYGATWQGLNRSTAANSMFRALVRRPVEWYSAGDNSILRAGNLERIFEVFDQLFASGSTPDPDGLLVVCSPPTQRWLEARVVAAQNGMQDISAGHVLAGLVMSGFRVTAGRSEVIVPVKQDLAVPDGTFLIADMARIGVWEKMALQGINPEGAGGTMQFATPGSRALTIERWGRTRYNVFTPRCDTSAVINGIDITA